LQRGLVAEGGGCSSGRLQLGAVAKVEIIAGEELINLAMGR